MSGLTMDFTNTNEFDTIPQGKYVCRLFDVEKKMTRNNDPMYVLTLKIESEGEHKGRQLFFNLPIMPTTAWKVKQTLEALGETVPKGQFTFDFHEFLGRRCVAIVAHRTWEGKVKEDVKELQAASGEDVSGTVGSDIPF